jgi:long-chain fatty acid transport protein
MGGYSMKVSVIRGFLLSALFASTQQTYAAGFALIEQSASGMGNAFAGGSASAEDASTVYFNPAGMTYIQGTQIVGALHLIKPSAEFNNNGTVAATGRPLGGSGGDAGDLAFVPNIYLVTDITPTIKAGLGINAPFGLKTEYDNDWMGRFQAIKSELKTVNINPSIAYKVNDQLSLGVGVSAMWTQAELTKAVNAVASESSVKVKGDDWGYGYNLGAVFQATSDTRFGIAYRSKVNQHLEGTSSSAFTALNASPTQTLNTNISASVVLPENVSLSAFSRIDDKWDLMGDVTWTHWSRFKELRIIRENGTGSTLAVTTENWHNTLRYSIGANYHYSDTLKFRAGLAYDEEAIDDQFRTARIPGNDRKWVSLGAAYQVTPAGRLDVGYAHLFISDATINDDQSSATQGRAGHLIGSYDGDVNILSLQYTHNF